MDKTLLKRQAFNYLGQFGENMSAKFTNICGKTGQYDVPSELFQKRTPRKNRVLISWSAVRKNNFTIEQLNTFEGGVVVNFINNDLFDKENQNNELFNVLKNRIGSNENVSAIISIKTEAGSSSSSIQRAAFKQLINNTKINYNGSIITINGNNYTKYALKQVISGKGQGNETWSGFLYISIKGGQQDTIETHSGQQLTLFNPACEYASSKVCTDIDLVMSYYALKCIDDEQLRRVGASKIKLSTLIDSIEKALASTTYDSPAYTGNLLDYVKHQYSIALIPGSLTDPIQIKPITIDKFNIRERKEDSIDFTHEEAVIYEKYYWDSKNNCILSPARPTNVFWSYHLSNMMQQNFNLDDYFKYEEERHKKRQELISNNS